MNPEILNQLMQVFQQGLTLLQQAQQQGGMGGAADTPADPMQPDGAMPDQMPQGEDDGTADAIPGQMPPDGGGDGMGDGGSLHDRVAALEDHTGLEKSAGTLSDRIDRLEEGVLGELYDGPMNLRVGQLEKAAGVTNTAAASASPQGAESATVPSYPEGIQLDALIKSAIEIGVAQGLERAFKQSGDSQEQQGLPALDDMRKTAKNQRTSYGQSKAVPTTVVGSGENLVKAAESWGYGESDLDKPASFGDVLQFQYEASRQGIELPDDDD